MNKNINFSSVLNYYELQSYSITNGNGGMNTEFSLVGKVRKTNLLVYFLFAGVFTLIYGLMAYFDGSMKKLIITGIIALVSLVVIFIHYLILTKKVNPNIRQLDFYHRELPSNLKPAHVRMLLNDGLIDELSIAATLLDLIDRGYLSIQGVEKKDNLFEKNTNIIISKTSKDTSDLLRYESFLINWFFFSCNNTPTISSFALREALKNSNANANYDMFKSLVLLSFPMDAFYKDNREKTKTQNKIYFGAILVGFFGAFICPYLIFAPLYGLAGSLFLSPSYTLNIAGATEINNWLSIRNFLRDFMNQSEKSIQMIDLWEYYLTYSLALDISDNIKNEIFDFFGKDIDHGDETSGREEKEEFSSIEEYVKRTQVQNDYIRSLVEEEKMKYNFRIN